MTSRGRWLAGGAALFAAVVQGAFAPCARAAGSARPLREAITVEPGATCLDAQTLIEQVQSWIEADTVDTDVVIDVRGSPDQPRVAAFRMLREGRVTALRTFDPGPSRCEQLHAVLGLAIAMALNASLIEEVAPTAVAIPIPASTSAPLRAPSHALPWAVALDALAALAVLPDPAFGVGARIERSLTPLLRARLGLLGVLALGETFDGAPGHFTTWLLAPRLDVCASLDVTSRVQAHGCMGVSGGGVHAQGYSYPSSRSTFIPWLAVVNELGVTVDLGPRWAIDADGSLLLPVARDSIVVRDYSENVLLRRDLAPAGWIFGVGPLFRF